MDDLNTEYTRSEAEKDFLKMFEDPPEEASEKSEGAKEPESEETTEEAPHEEETTEEETEGTEEDPGESEETEDKPRRSAEDEDEVTVKVGDEEHKVSVKDLKRLFGQEKALTQKSQAQAEASKKAEEALKAAEDVRQARLTALNKLVDHARKEYEPYSKIDFALAAKDMTVEDYTALRDAANKAYTNYRFLTEDLNGEMGKAEQERATRFREEAAAAIKYLENPDTGIKGWNQTVYNDIRQFAVKAGMAEQIVNNITDPHALKMIWKAMQYDKGQQVATKKIATSVKKPIKSVESKSSTTESDSTKSLMNRLKRSGDRADAQALFEARMG